MEIDPDGVEPAALLEVADFERARVLEIGTGDGRLAFRYAPRTSFCVGIEPKADEIASAVAGRPSHLRGRLSFVQASAITLPFRAESFTTALFAWSL